MSEAPQPQQPTEDSSQSPIHPPVALSDLEKKLLLHIFELEQEGPTDLSKRETNKLTASFADQHDIRGEAVGHVDAGLHFLKEKGLVTLSPAGVGWLPLNPPGRPLPRGVLQITPLGAQYVADIQHANKPKIYRRGMKYGASIAIAAAAAGVGINAWFFQNPTAREIFFKNNEPAIKQRAGKILEAAQGQSERGAAVSAAEVINRQIDKTLALGIFKNLDALPLVDVPLDTTAPDSARNLEEKMKDFYVEVAALRDVLDKQYGETRVIVTNHIQDVDKMVLEARQGSSSRMVDYLKDILLKSERGEDIIDRLGTDKEFRTQIREFLAAALGYTRNETLGQGQSR